MHQPSPSEHVPIFRLLTLPWVLTDCFVPLSPSWTIRFMTPAIQLLDHSLTSHSLSQLGHIATLVHTRLNRLILTLSITGLCHKSILVLSWTQSYSGPGPLRDSTVFNLTIGPSPNRSSCDPYPLLDLIILIPTLGQPPTWLCCDPHRSLDLIDFSLAISAGAIR